MITMESMRAALETLLDSRGLTEIKLTDSDVQEALRTASMTNADRALRRAMRVVMDRRDSPLYSFEAPEIREALEAEGWSIVRTDSVVVDRAS